MTAEYEPGVCNIGRAERRARYGFGAVGFGAAAALVAAIPVLSLPDPWLLSSAVPLFGGFIGYYQGRRGFCVRFAMAGVYNVGDDLGPRTEVADAEAARRDRRRAQQLVLRAAVSAAAVAVGAFLVVPAIAG